MTVQQVIGLFVRLVALYFASMVLGTLSGAFGIADMGLNSATMIITALIYAALAYFLWAFPMMIAHRILPRTNGTEKIITNNNQLAVAGVALIGLFLFVQVFPSFIGQFNYAFIMQKEAGGSVFDMMVLDEERKIKLLSMVFELILAIILMLNARKVARFLTR